jgi:hypothetical protein
MNTRETQLSDLVDFEIVNNVRSYLADKRYRNEHERSYQAAWRFGKKKLTVKQYPEGFSAFELRDEGDLEFGDYWMKDSGRSLSVANPEPARPVPEQFDVSRSGARRRFKKRTLRLWSLLFSGDEDIELSSGDYKLVSRFSHDPSAICVERYREEYYLPMAYLYKNRPIGGNYLHIWESGTVGQLKVPRLSVSLQPVKEFFTGGCMLGSTLYGVDQFGNQHPLTNPYHKMDEGSVVQLVVCPHSSHPDEIVTRESLRNSVALIKVLGQGYSPVLRYHLPLANYLIYGINWFFQGKLSKAALTQYVDHVKARSAVQRQVIEKIACESDIEINIFSTLDVLGLAESPSERILENLFSVIGLPSCSFDQLGVEDLLPLRSQMIDKIIAYLSLDCFVGEVWGHIQNKVDEGSFSFEAGDLLSINYMDYSANLAIAAKSHGDREVVSLLPSHESPVSYWYKKTFAEKFGAVLCFQWLSPVQVHVAEYRNRIFYIDDNIEELNVFFESGIIAKSFLQTAAIALDSVALSEKVNGQVRQKILSHGYKTFSSLLADENSLFLENLDLVKDDDFQQVRTTEGEA